MSQVVPDECGHVKNRRAELLPVEEVPTEAVEEKAEAIHRKRSAAADDDQTCSSKVRAKDDAVSLELAGSQARWQRGPLEGISANGDAEHEMAAPSGRMSAAADGAESVADLEGQKSRLANIDSEPGFGSK